MRGIFRGVYLSTRGIIIKESMSQDSIQIEYMEVQEQMRGISPKTQTWQRLDCAP